MSQQISRDGGAFMAGKAALQSSSEHSEARTAHFTFCSVSSCF
jgi:hypothetical protein